MQRWPTRVDRATLHLAAASDIAPRQTYSRVAVVRVGRAGLQIDSSLAAVPNREWSDLRLAPIAASGPKLVPRDQLFGESPCIPGSVRRASSRPIAGLECLECDVSHTASALSLSRESV